MSSSIDLDALVPLKTDQKQIRQHLITLTLTLMLWVALIAFIPM